MKKPRAMGIAAAANSLSSWTRRILLAICPGTSPRGPRRLSESHVHLHLGHGEPHLQGPRRGKGRNTVWRGGSDAAVALERTACSRRQHPVHRANVHVATTCPSTATCHHHTHLVPQRLGQVLPRPIDPYLPDVGVPPVLVVGQHGQLQQVGLEVRAAEQWVEWLWEGVGKRRAQRHGPGLTGVLAWCPCCAAKLSAAAGGLHRGS